VFQWLFRPDLPKPDKLPRNTYCSNLTVKKQVTDFHQAINLLVVDDVAHILQLVPNVLIPIATELLLQYTLYVLQDHCIVHPFTILPERDGSGFSTTYAFSSLVVETTAGNI
jgi:hypothetical protein